MTIMLLEASIPLSVLFYVMLGLVGTAALIVLIIFLIKATSAAGHISKLVKDITPDLEKSVEKLPSTMENIEIISGNLVDITDELADATPQLLDDVELVVGMLGSTAESLSFVLTGLTDGFSTLFSRRHKAAEPGTLSQLLAIAGALLGLLKRDKEQDTGKTGKKKKKK